MPILSRILSFSGRHLSTDHGKFAAFNHAVFTVLFQDDHDIGKLEILLQIAEKFGLNSKDLASGSQVYFICKR